MSAADAFKSKYQSAADSAATSAGVPTDLFSAVVANESSWNPYAVSSAGAIGLAQLMPGTAKDLGVNPWNPDENLSGGASYLGALYKKFGNWRDALAGYNAGPGNLKAGYGYADKILGAVPVDPMGSGPSNMPGSTGDATVDAQYAAGGGLQDWLIGAVKRAGFLILALLLLAFGIWAMIANKESARPS